MTRQRQESLMMSSIIAGLSRLSPPRVRPLYPGPMGSETFKTLLGLRLASTAHHVVRREPSSWQGCFSPEQQDQLRRSWVSAKAQTVVVHQALTQVINKLDQAPSIPTLVIKGVAAQYRIYRHPALRPVGDIDLWVPPGAREQAWSRLQELGFWMQDSRDPRKPAWQLRHSKKISVDLHAHLRQAQRLNLPFDSVFASHQVLELDGLRLALPDDDHLFLTQAYALASSEFCQSFNTWIDLRELLLASHLHVDWRRVQMLAQPAGLQNVMWKVHRQLLAMFEELRDLIETPARPSLLERTMLDLALPFATQASGSRPMSRARQTLAKIALIQGLDRRARFVASIVGH